MCVIERKGESVWVFVSAFLRNSYTHTHIHAQPLIDETVCDANDCAEDIGAECVAHTNSTYYCDCSAVVLDTDNPNLVAGGKTCNDVIDTKVYKRESVYTYICM
jgi:hypothetical protein